jgi:hypothetical protein
MNIGLGACVVMPNHFHGIIHIRNNPYNTPIEQNECRDVMHRVSTDTVWVTCSSKVIFSFFSEAN